MRILILNWRDIQNPKGGGAEILTFEIAKRWVALGHEVTQFSERFNGSKSEETMDGVKIIRGGCAQILSFHIPVHIAAFFWYLKHKDNFDIVIDEIHGIPFFTPFYVRTKKIALICEVAGDIWDVAFAFPINKLGRFIEDNYFHFYKNMSFLTISPSTKKSLLEMGVKKDNIYVVPMGITVPNKLRDYPKSNVPTLIFVGRLSKTKGIEDAIHVFKKIREVFPNSKFWIVGRGEENYEKELKNIVQKLGLADVVIFFGFVSEKKKNELMGRAHILIVPSIKEGWGLVVGEAGIRRTPSVVYDVPGLKDTVIDKETGLIVEATRDAMVSAVLMLLRDKKIYSRLKEGAYNLSKSYNWDKTARYALSVVVK